MLSLRTVAGRDEKTTAALCADAHEFSLHAGVRCGAHQRKELERICRYITRPAIANERQLWRKSTVNKGSFPAFVDGRVPATSCPPRHELRRRFRGQERGTKPKDCAKFEQIFGHYKGIARSDPKRICR